MMPAKLNLTGKRFGETVTGVNLSVLAWMIDDEGLVG